MFRWIFCLALIVMVGCGDDDGDDGVRSGDNIACAGNDECSNDCLGDGPECNLSCRGSAVCSGTCQSGKACNFTCTDSAQCDFDCTEGSCEINGTSPHCECSGNCSGVCGGRVIDNDGGDGDTSGGNNGSGGPNLGDCDCGPVTSPDYAACVAACHG